MSQTEKKNDPREERPYEEVVGGLEEVVESLERGDLALERSLELFEEGVRLSRQASRRLDQAERRIRELLADGSLVPLDTGAAPEEHEES